VIVGLDQQVKVIALDADVDDAKVALLDDRVHGSTDRVIGVRPPECRDGSDHAQRDVNRCRTREPNPSLVWLARASALRRPPRALALPAPGLEFECLLTPTLTRHVRDRLVAVGILMSMHIIDV
jgi:hypothetical protein